MQEMCHNLHSATVSGVSLQNMPSNVPRVILQDVVLTLLATATKQPLVIPTRNAIDITAPLAEHTATVHSLASVARSTRRIKRNVTVIATPHSSLLTGSAYLACLLDAISALR